MFLVRRSNDYEGLRREIEPIRARLLEHPMYGDVNTVERLRLFMQVHVFAVWDFMSLAKRLQREFTCTELPWMPPTRPMLSRFANEVILSEESDHGLDGAPRSHLEMYLDAMEEVGSSTVQFRSFMRALGDGRSVSDALTQAEVPRFIRNFVNETIDCARSGTSIGVMSAFLFGREDLIPEMFERLLPLWDGRGSAVPHFAYYLKRHIELDGDEHGPIATAALTDMAGHSSRAWREAARSAKRALRARIELWDGVCKSIVMSERTRRRERPSVRFTPSPAR